MSSRRKGRQVSNTSVQQASLPGYNNIIVSENLERTMRQKDLDRNQQGMEIPRSVYSNPRFMHVVTALTGNTARVHTRDGEVYEGIFNTFSPSFDVALSAAHKVDKNSEMESKTLIETFTDYMVFQCSDVIEIRMKDVELDYAVKDSFATDTAISSSMRLNGGDSFEKELEPWIGDPNDNTDLSLDNANGWDPDEMFKRNEVVYGVTSTFSQSLEGYTVPLNVRDSSDFKEMEAMAARIEREIKASPSYDAATELENIDEEEKYSAVVRPGENWANARSVSPQSTTSGGSGGKYIHPNKRKGNAGKPTRPGQHNLPPRHQATFQQQQSFDGDRDREPQPQRFPPRGRTSPSQAGNSHNAQQRGGPPPGNQRVTSPKNGQQGPSPTQNFAPSTQQPVTRTQVPPQQASPAGYYKQQAPTGNFTPAALRGPPEPVHVNGEAKMVRPAGPAPSRVHVVQGTPVVVGMGLPPKQIQQKPREEQTAELKKFGQDFRLVEPGSAMPPPERKVTSPSQPTMAPPMVHPTHVPPPNMVPPPQPSGNSVDEVSTSQLSPAHMSSAQPGAASPSPSVDESDKSPTEDKEMDSLSASMSKSKLNPNAKEFVFNPSAKAFTPRSPGAPTPPRSMTPQQAPISVIPTGPLSAQGVPIVQSMPVVYYPAVSGPSVGTALPMHSPVVPQQQFVPSPNTMRAYRPRAVQVASSQVASVTGQPLLAPGPLPSHPFTVQYTPQGAALMTPQGAALMAAGASQHFPQFSQVPTIYRLMPQPAGMIPLVATSSYGESPHSSQGHIHMTTVPTPAQTPGGSNGQAPNLYQPPTPSPALVNPPPQGTPTGAPHHQQPHVIFTPQPTAVTPGGGPPPQNVPPPGGPHAFPMVYMPAGHQGPVTHMLPFQQGPNAVTMGMIPQLHYFQAPVSSGQGQQHLVQQNQ